MGTKHTALWTGTHRHMNQSIPSWNIPFCELFFGWWQTIRRTIRRRIKRQRAIRRTMESAAFIGIVKTFWMSIDIEILLEIWDFFVVRFDCFSLWNVDSKTSKHLKTCTLHQTVSTFQFENVYDVISRYWPWCLVKGASQNNWWGPLLTPKLETANNLFLHFDLLNVNHGKGKIDDMLCLFCVGYTTEASLLWFTTPCRL